jgi:cation diffusion facilitator family transporter
MKKENKNDNKYAYYEVVLSIIINCLLFILKFWAGIVTGSVALIADAWHTLSDSITSGIVLMGFIISSMPADVEHPFGHGRAERISSTIIGVLLAIVGLNFLTEAFNALKNHVAVEYGLLAIVATVISIIAKEFLYQYAKWAGNKIDSIALKADAYHHRSDAFSSIIILIGIFLNKYFWQIDGILGIIVAIFIFFASFEILNESINTLLGEKPTAEFLDAVKKICDEVSPREIFVHHIHLHRYGKHLELTFHIKLPGNLTLNVAHNLSENIEQEIKKQLKCESTIHIDPINVRGNQ